MIWAVIVGATAVAIAMWMLRREIRRAPHIQDENLFYEEGKTKIELAPWSPTRGNYYFDPAKLPAIYQTLDGVTDAGWIVVFAEGPDEAMEMLQRLMIGRALKKFGPDMKIEPVGVLPDNFKPLMRRKLDRPYDR